MSQKDIPSIRLSNRSTYKTLLMMNAQFKTIKSRKEQPIMSKNSRIKCPRTLDNNILEAIK